MKYFKQLIVIALAFSIGAFATVSYASKVKLVMVPEYIAGYKTTDLLSYVATMKASQDLKAQVPTGTAVAPVDNTKTDLQVKLASIVTQEANLKADIASKTNILKIFSNGQCLLDGGQDVTGDKKAYCVSLEKAISLDNANIKDLEVQKQIVNTQLNLL